MTTSLGNGSSALLRKKRAASARSSLRVETDILLTSYTFWPQVGGLEAVTQMLARHFLRAGRSVTVVTETPYEGEEPFPYPVVRRPSAGRLVAQIRGARCVLQNHPSFRLGWPLLATRTPLVVAVHNWLVVSGVRGLAMRALLLRSARCVAISEAIAEQLPVASTIVPSPYDEEIFWSTGKEKRARDCLFVGRMHRDKGPLLFLEALGLLQAKGLLPTATLLGDGPVLSEAQALARRLGMEDRVEFLGSRAAEEVARLMREHRILVVPSIWQEPFGIVALEGIACGCAVVGSQEGGLKAAIGPCGLTFPNGDGKALAARLGELLTEPELSRKLLAHAPEHLRPLTSRAIADRYLEILDEILCVS